MFDQPSFEDDQGLVVLHKPPMQPWRSCIGIVRGWEQFLISGISWVTKPDIVLFIENNDVYTFVNRVITKLRYENSFVVSVKCSSGYLQSWGGMRLSFTSWELYP